MPRAFGTTNAAPYASAPPVGAAGDTYWNTAAKALYASDGAVWNPIGAGGAATWIGASPPASPAVGQLWWRSDPDQNLYLYYDDGNSQQWVTAVPNQLSGAAVGGDLSGTLPNPTVVKSAGNFTVNGTLAANGPITGAFAMAAISLTGPWSASNTGTIVCPWKADLLISCSCSWYASATGMSTCALNFDGAALTYDLRQFFNEASSHKTMGTQNYKAGAAQGSHTFAPVYVTNATSDSNDFCRIGVMMVRVP